MLGPALATEQHASNRGAAEQRAQERASDSQHPGKAANSLASQSTSMDSDLSKIPARLQIACVFKSRVSLIQILSRKTAVLQRQHAMVKMVPAAPSTEHQTEDLSI